MQGMVKEVTPSLILADEIGEQPRKLSGIQGPFQVSEHFSKSKVILPRPLTRLGGTTAAVL